MCNILTLKTHLHIACSTKEVKVKYQTRLKWVSKNLLLLKKGNIVDKFKTWKRNSTSKNKADYAYALDRFRLAIQTEKAD